MKIALLTDGIYPFVLGGMQKHSFYLAKYLAKRGVQVDLYHCVPDGVETPNSLEGFSSKELNNINSFCFNFPKKHQFPGHYLYESKQYSNQLFEFFQKQEEVDFIYAQGFTSWRFLEEKKDKMTFPLIGVNFHGIEMYQLAANLRSKFEQLILRPPVKFILSNTDVIFSLGGKLTPIQQQISGNKIKVLEIPIGIEECWLKTEMEISEREESQHIRRFVFIGRFERRKGVEELTQVIKELVTDYIFEIHFIGPIPENKKMKSDKVFYHGQVKDVEFIKNILGKTDILVSSSYAEGMPTVILEAMASGLAIIATDVGAVSTIVSMENGWLIPPANKKALKKAMIEAIEINEQALIQKKEISLRLVKEYFTWDKIITTTIEVFGKLNK
jgi:glycosyltransferase involved in cell wall biosynthesis